MTSSLRRDHLRTWLVMAVLMLAVFAASLIFRRDTTPRNPNVHWSAPK